MIKSFKRGYILWGLVTSSFKKGHILEGGGGQTLPI